MCDPFGTRAAADQVFHLLHELNRAELSNRVFQFLDVVTFGVSYYLFYDFWVNVKTEN